MSQFSNHRMPDQPQDLPQDQVDALSMPLDEAEYALWSDALEDRFNAERGALESLWESGQASEGVDLSDEIPF